MTVELNHTIVPATDKEMSADFLSAILGIDGAAPWGPFMVLTFPHGVSLDFVDAGGFEQHHYAFLVDDAEFDPILDRIRAAGVAFYADPGRRTPGEINHHHGGRGIYFDDPDRHLMEVITRPYGATTDG